MNDLSPSEKNVLDKQGYLNLGTLLNPSQLHTIRQRIDELLLAEGEQAGSELFDSKHIRHPKEKGADRLADLVNKGAEFDIFYTHPKVLAAVTHVLGNYKLSSLNYRSAKPGDGHQKLHVDWRSAVTPGNYFVCNSIWLLDDFTRQNGATRVVPGSHLFGSMPEEVLGDPAAPHPDELLIEAKAGSVVIFNSHVWHGGTTNHSKNRRRALHSYFCQRDQIQQLDQARYLTSETKERIGERGTRILGV